MKTVTIEKRISSKDNEYIDNFFNDVSQYKLLNEEEEKELARKYREENDQIAKEKLINCNLRFVISVAKNYQTTGVPLSELISEGNVGLVKAIEKYDERKGYKFISYAVWWIRQSILFFISQNYNIIRPPMNRYNLLSKINDYNDDFYKKNNRKPTKNEIINHFNISSKQYEEIMQISQPHSYLFEKSSSDKDDDFQVIDCISSDFFQSTDIYIKNTSKQETIDAILSILDEREQDIIKSCYGFDDMTLNDLEEKYDICKTRIDQIKYEALKKLRTTEGINKLKQVLNNND